jgi:hypothetical protein
LDQLSQILSGQPYKPLGAPPSLPRHDAIVISRDHNMSKVIPLHLFLFMADTFSTLGTS